MAEHCLGHVLSRIERTYNRYRYLPEKREAFEKMAEHVQRIVNPPAGANVVQALSVPGGAMPSSSNYRWKLRGFAARFQIKVQWNAICAGRASPGVSAPLLLLSCSCFAIRPQATCGVRPVGIATSSS